MGRFARVGALAIGALVVPLSVVAATLDRAATVAEHADRGTDFQAAPTLPPPPGCGRVIVIGDSLTDNSEPWLVDRLRAAGHRFLVDAHPTRRIPGRVRAPYSGVRAAHAARATFGDADCWLVALGSNDLIYGGGDPTLADAMIAEMVAAVTPGALVWWTNVNYHRDPRTTYDFVRATAVFNERLARRAATDPAFAVIDWYSLSEPNPAWFFDPVHVDRAASIVRAEQAVEALPPPRP